MTEGPLLRTRELAVGYGKSALLPPFSLEIGEGQFWAVIGRNGCGKTTWIRTLLGLVPPVGGQIERRTGLRISYLHQRSVADDLYPVTARDVVAMGCLRGYRAFRPDRHQRRSVDQALEAMDARELAHQSFRSLSEGQRQRVLFARIAASGAELALLDEPTSAMDLVAEREAFSLLVSLCQRSRAAILIVSHYLRLVSEYADHAVLLDRDTPSVVVGTPAEVLGHAAFQASYGPNAPLS